jgi:hypothetical protein
LECWGASGVYSDVLSLDIVPSESFAGHELPALLGTPLVDGHMKKKLVNVHEAMYSLVTSGYGSLIEGCAGFAVYQMGVGGFGHKIQRSGWCFHC